DQRRGEQQRLLQGVGVLRLETVRVPREPDVVVRERDVDVVAAWMEEPAQPCAVEDRPVGRERIVAGGDEDDEAAGEERQQGGDDRRDDAARAREDVEALGHARCVSPRLLVRRLLSAKARSGRTRTDPLAHATASSSSRVAPIIARPSVSALTSGPYSPTIRPSYMTRIRSESAWISSSSSEMSSTARPSSRSATSPACT